MEPTETQRPSVTAWPFVSKHPSDRPRPARAPARYSRMSAAAPASLALGSTFLSGCGVKDLPITPPQMRGAGESALHRNVEDGRCRFMQELLRRLEPHAQIELRGPHVEVLEPHTLELPRRNADQRRERLHG